MSLAQIIMLLKSMVHSIFSITSVSFLFIFAAYFT